MKLAVTERKYSKVFKPLNFKNTLFHRSIEHIKAFYIAKSRKLFALIIIIIYTYYKKYPALPQI